MALSEGIFKEKCPFCITTCKIGFIDPFHNDVEYVWKWGKWCDSLLSKDPSSYLNANSTTTKQIYALLKAMHAFGILIHMITRIVMFLEEFQKNWRHRERDLFWLLLSNPLFSNWNVCKLFLLLRWFGRLFFYQLCWLW